MYNVINNKIYMTRGDTVVLNLSIEMTGNKDKSEYDLKEGDIVELTIRKSPKSSRVIFNKKFISKTIEIKPEDTKELPFGEYCYDVQLTLANGMVDTIIGPSPIFILEEVTY